MVTARAGAGALLATAALVMAGCSGSHDSGARNEVVNPCFALAGRAVGSEIDASNPSGGRLATPPKACAAAADLSSSGGCYPSGRASGDLFWFTSGEVTAVGKPGGRWIVVRGQYERSDAARVGC